jgi:hypothetical protein
MNSNMRINIKHKMENFNSNVTHIILKDKHLWNIEEKKDKKIIKSRFRTKNDNKDINQMFKP